MGKKILLICNYFAPDHTIAAVRTSKLTKYLQKDGYEVEVVTERKNAELEDEILKRDIIGIKTYYAANSRLFIKISSLYKKIMEPHKKKRFDNLDNRNRLNPKTGKVEFYPFETAYPILGSLDYLMGLLKQYDLFRSVKSLLGQLDGFDYVITSYGDAFSIYAGRYYHRCHKEISWIFDIRDAIYRYKFTPDYVKWIAEKFEHDIWKNADCILGVSKGICKRVPVKYRHKVHCLTNGFDLSDRQGLTGERLNTPNMVFTYTGSMYGGLVNLSVFFASISQAAQQGLIKPDEIEFHFAGNNPAFEIFKNQARKYGLDHRCMTHGKLSRKDAMQLQQQSDFLLVASHDYQNNEGGVITGKTLEYMAAGRPIIALVMGDIEHSELADIIRKSGLGIAYEDFHKEKDFDLLCRYLGMKYKEFTETGAVSHMPDVKELRKYDYKNLGKRLVRIIEQIGK